LAEPEEEPWQIGGCAQFSPNRAISLAGVPGSVNAKSREIPARTMIILYTVLTVLNKQHIILFEVSNAL
jgi:hypothetical protein